MKVRVATAPLSWIQWLFLGLLAIGFLLPSDGDHGLLSPKGLALLALLYGMAIAFLVGVPIRSHALIPLGAALVGFLLLSWLVALRQGFLPSQLDQLKLLTITLVVPLVGSWLAEEDSSFPERCFQIAIAANFFYNCVKVIAFWLQWSGYLEPLYLLQNSGVRLITMEIGGGFIRLQTSLDLATGYLLHFALYHRRLAFWLPGFFLPLYLLLALFSLFLSFSRYLMAVALLVLLAAALLRSTGSSRWLTLALSLGLLLAFVFSSEGDWFYKVVDRRLFSQENYESDQMRLVQAEALCAEAEQSPFFGKGVGSYAIDCIRDPQLPHSYEVQWAALGMQLGLVGLACLSIGGLLIALPLVTHSWDGFRLTTLGFYLLFLLSGWTNPYLLSLLSGLLYFLFYLAGVRAMTRQAPEKIIRPRALGI